MEPKTIEESKLITISCRTLRVSFQKFRKISKFSVEEVPVPGGGDSHMEQTGMLVGNR